jgi:hypothetical protein
MIQRLKIPLKDCYSLIIARYVSFRRRRIVAPVVFFLVFGVVLFFDAQPLVASEVIAPGSLMRLSAVNSVERPIDEPIIESSDIAEDHGDVKLPDPEETLKGKTADEGALTSADKKIDTPLNRRVQEPSSLGPDKPPAAVKSVVTKPIEKATEKTVAPPVKDASGVAVVNDSDAASSGKTTVKVKDTEAVVKKGEQKEALPEPTVDAAHPKKSVEKVVEKPIEKAKDTLTKPTVVKSPSAPEPAAITPAPEKPSTVKKTQAKEKTQTPEKTPLLEKTKAPEKTSEPLPAKASQKAVTKPLVKKPSVKPSKKVKAKVSEKAPAKVSSSPQEEQDGDEDKIVNSMRKAQKKGPIEVRVKRLYGFDARLSGVSFGWVNQIDIDDTNDEIYLLDKSNKRIVVTNIVGSYLFHFNYTLAGIKNPTVFAVDSMSGEIYIADGPRIVVLNYRGELQGDFNLSQIPGNQKISIQSLRLIKGKEGDLVYIGDNLNRRVLVVTTEGKFVRSYGNSKWVGYNIKGLYVAKERIFWLDTTGFSVKSIGIDGKDKKTFGRISSLTGGFSMPSGMTVDEVNKRIFVVDSNRMMIIAFDYDGNTLFEFGGPRLFTWPRAVAVDKLGHIFVADNRGVIRVFQAVPVDK